MQNKYPIILLSLLLFLFADNIFSGELRRFVFEETVMSIPSRVIVCAENEADAKRAADAVFQRFDELNHIMSDYDSESEVMRICQEGAKSGEPMRVSGDLFRVLKFSKQISTASDGAFDITVGPIVRLWRRARRMHAFPEKKLLENARQLVGNDLWEIDETSQTVTLKRDKMRFDLGGIAKGDAIDQAVEILKKHKIPAALVDVGGDIRCYGKPPRDSARLENLKQNTASSQNIETPNEENHKKNEDNKTSNENKTNNNENEKSNANKNFGNENKKNDDEVIADGWIIGVSANGQMICSIDAQEIAMASSGDAERFVELNGVRYSHIVDPKTGLGLTDRKAVTVFAKDAITADALASALSVLPPEKGLKLLDQYADTAAMICRQNESGTEIFYSESWKELKVRR